MNNDALDRVREEVTACQQLAHAAEVDDVDAHEATREISQRLSILYHKHLTGTHARQAGQDNYKAWYEEAMVASNEAGYVGLNAAQTIRALAALVSEDCRAVCEAALVAHGVFFAIGQRARPDSPALEAIWTAVDAMLAAQSAQKPTPPPNSIA